MRILKSILLATDLRPASQEAAKVAVKLASAFESRVTLLHVIEPLPNWPVELHEREKEGPLREVAAELAGQKVEVAESSIVVGPPANTILDKAQEIDADLILIGAGDRTGLFRFSGGPTAQTVIEHAPQPVLAVRPGQPALEFRKILCPVDQSGPSGQGLRNAIRLAQALGGELVILSVVPEVSWLTAAVETRQFSGAKAEYESKWRDEFDRFLAGIPTHEVKAKTEVRHGAPHEQIIAAAKDHQADVIIMGATGRTGLVRVLLGSTTRRVLEQLPCSLLTVKQEDVVAELFQGEVRLIKQLMAEGRKLLSSGAHDAARAKFRQVLAHNPFDVAATEGLVESYEKLGQHDLARYYRRRADNLQEKP
jgi:nucleotide-binding universal stress UspA family protein